MSKEEVIKKIAADFLQIDTFEIRHSDDLDYSEQAVWMIKGALDEAYMQGFKEGQQS